VNLTNIENGSNVKDIELTDQQKEYVKKFGWGKIEITIKGGKPILVSLKKDIAID